MAADIAYHSEPLPLFITHRKVRRSRCMCLLFLFLVAAFVGLVPIIIYRSLGVPLPGGLRGHRNVQPWMIVPQSNGSPSPETGEAQIQPSVQSQSPAVSTRSRTIVTPKTHLHSFIPTRPSSSIAPPDLPSTTDLHPTP